MTVFKNSGWFKSLTDKLRPQSAANQADSMAEASSTEPAVTTEKTNLPLKERIISNKWLIVKSAAAVGMMAVVVWSGHQYVEASMVDYYRVFANGEEVGIVLDPAKVEQFKQTKRQELTQTPDNVRVVVKEPQLEFKRERAFKENADDQAMLDKLSAYFSATPVGIQLAVDGKQLGYVRDQQTADQLLEQVKANAVAALQKKKDPGRVGILAAPASQPVASELQKAEFVQKVETSEVPIDPKALSTPEAMLSKLETGNAQPTKYTVEKGDCVGCIAKKLGIPKQVIYQNNPSITDDMIKVGQQLDLTVMKPELSVRTVEKIVENQEIQFETETKQDDSMRLGESQVLVQGSNGLKQMTIQLVKVNGLLEGETVLNEDIKQQPVKAVVKKGTKVIKGEGSGKFAWPVVSASISSTFGTRWGAFHKGVDLTGNKNILASDNGKVVFAGVKEGYGNCIIIDHMNGYRTLYGHLSQILTESGKIVEKGEKIGIMGSTGDSTGVHLHFEVQRDETPDNPLKYLNR